MDTGILFTIIFPVGFIIFGVVLLVRTNAASKQAAADRELRKQEALERGDIAAASEIDSQPSPSVPRDDWKKPAGAPASLDSQHKNLARNLTIGGFVLVALSFFNGAAAGAPHFAWFDLAVNVLAIILIVAGVVLDPPWRKT